MRIRLRIMGGKNRGLLAKKFKKKQEQTLYRYEFFFLCQADFLLPLILILMKAEVDPDHWMHACTSCAFIIRLLTQRGIL